jgi:hypothetical protein
MPRISSFLMGMICGAAAVMIAMNFYIIRTKESFHLVPKVAAKLEMPYYDVRAYTLEDWHRHPSLAAAIVTSKNQSLVKNSGVESVRSKVEGLLQQWTGSL